MLSFFTVGHVLSHHQCLCRSRAPGPLRRPRHPNLAMHLAAAAFETSSNPAHLHLPYHCILVRSASHSLAFRVFAIELQSY